MIDYRKIDTDRSPDTRLLFWDSGDTAPIKDPAVQKAERIARDVEARQRFQKGMHWK